VQAPKEGKITANHYLLHKTFIMSVKLCHSRIQLRQGAAGTYEGKIYIKLHIIA
jgi:hypothetical protein